MTYSKQFVDAVRDAADIVEIIGEVVELREYNGDRHKGLCPFHNESTPSFTVSNNLWYCFGCGEGGDAIRFIERTQNISFGAALRQLGNRYGLQPEATVRWVGRPKKRPLQGITQPEGYVAPVSIPDAINGPAASQLFFERCGDCPPADDFVDLLLTLGIVPSYLVLELWKDVGMPNMPARRDLPG